MLLPKRIDTIMEVIMDKIIDLHNHSLPYVDDGAKDMKEAIKNIRYLHARGITSIVLTSHYIYNSKYSIELIDRKKIFDKLKEYFKDEDINLYLGNEVFICDSDILLDLIKKLKIATINRSRYLLIEFPIILQTTFTIPSISS